jgi:hypothetical protein
MHNVGDSNRLETLSKPMTDEEVHPLQRTGDQKERRIDVATHLKDTPVDWSFVDQKLNKPLFPLLFRNG